MNSKHISISLVFALSATLCISTSSFAGASVKAPAKAGRTITDPLNTLRNGKGAPSSSLGINGDFYIDLSTFNIYGPKANNKWSTPTSLRGPKGLPGVAGAKSTSSSVGVKGIQGIQGVPGEKGATGEKGTIGETGLQGTAGISGGGGGSSPGAPGTSGAAGAAGSQGIQGLQGIQGMQGATGNTGSAGSSGGSAVSVGNVSFVSQILGGGQSSTESSLFGTFAAGKIYMIDLLLYANSPANDPGSLRLTISASGGAPVVSTAYLVTHQTLSNRGGSLGTESSIHAKILIDGSIVLTNFQLIATVSKAQFSDITDGVTVQGTYFEELVGSLM